MCLWSCVGYDQRQGCEPCSCHHEESSWLPIFVCVPLEEKVYSLLYLSFMTQGPTKCIQQLLYNLEKCTAVNLEMLSCLLRGEGFLVFFDLQGFHLITQLYCAASHINTTQIGMWRLMSHSAKNIINRICPIYFNPKTEHLWTIFIWFESYVSKWGRISPQGDVIGGR